MNDAEALGIHATAGESKYLSHLTPHTYEHAKRSEARAKPEEAQGSILSM